MKIWNGRSPEEMRTIPGGAEPVRISVNRNVAGQNGPGPTSSAVSKPASSTFQWSRPRGTRACATGVAPERPPLLVGPRVGSIEHVRSGRDRVDGRVA